ncbi:MAG TPA: Hpt domain-containing protein [Bryobacterales bacterium]|nr:Hpt domain-containing protein [Bryobacterales bacterium]
MQCFDQQRLREAAMHDDEFMVELIDLFLDDMPSQLEWLRRGVGQADPDEVRKAAHRIRGAAGNVGAERLSGLCSDMERVARETELPPLGDLLGNVEQEWQQIKAAMEALRKATANGN